MQALATLASLCPARLLSTPSAATRLLAIDVQNEETERHLRPSRRPLRLLLIRHGESAMNVQPGLIGGRSNWAPLTELGRQQARELGRRFRKTGLRPDMVCSSTAVRAQETARVCLDAMYCSNQGGESSSNSVRPEIHLSPDILELCQGEYTGQDRSVIYNDAFLEEVGRERLFLRAPGLSHVDDDAPGESLFDVEVRVGAFVDALLEKEKRPDEVVEAHGAKPRIVAIFMHGLAIRCFLRRIMGGSTTASMHSQTDNTSITELEYRTGPHNLDGWQVVRTNDAAHLEGMPL